MDREHEEWLCALSDFERMRDAEPDPEKKARYENICAGIRARLEPTPAQRTAAQMRAIFDEITQERIRQDAKWGGPEHDDTHTPSDWHNLNAEHVFRTIEYDVDSRQWYPTPAYRQQWVRAAALAVAAIQAYDRQHTGGTMPEGKR